MEKKKNSKRASHLSVCTLSKEHDGASRECVRSADSREQRVLAYISIFRMRTGYVLAKFCPTSASFWRATSHSARPNPVQSCQTRKEGAGSPWQLHTCQERRGPMEGAGHEDARGTMRAKSNRVICQRGVRLGDTERVRDWEKKKKNTIETGDRGFNI